MKNPANRTRQHYEADGESESLVSRVTRVLNAVEPSLVSPSQLGGLDQFHVGGLAATLKLAELAEVKPGMKVLDAGSGLGGPSRYLAETFGCSVTGVDLTPAFVEVAKLLAGRAGLTEQVNYVVGELSAMSFPGESFDLVWTQHVVMNIGDREQVYRELHRVLKPDGKLAFYDVIAAEGKPEPHFPLPWAASSEASFLLTADETTSTLEMVGLRVISWNDVTAEALASFSQTQPPPLDGLSLITTMGPRFKAMIANLARNVREGRLRLVMGICNRMSSPQL